MLTRRKGLLVAQKIGANHYLESSAKTGEGLQEIFQAAARASLTTFKPKKRKARSCIIV
jgi:Ras homolog gene family, member A